MIKSFLFDLDDTLLPYSCSQEETFESMIRSLAAYFSQWIHPDRFIPAFMKSVEAMDENRGGEATNLEVFSHAFSSLADFPADKFEEALINQWQIAGDTLQNRVDPSPYARDIMDWLLINEVEVVIATGLQAPLLAAELRLELAGIPVTNYEYKFIATWDNMHASKPHPEFYQEILKHIEREAEECLFIGDDWDSEIIPATKLGIRSYWITEPETVIPQDLKLLSGYGQLPQLYEWITNLDL